MYERPSLGERRAQPTQPPDPPEGANINEKDDDGSWLRALSPWAWGGHWDRRHSGNTPLHFAAYNGRSELVQVLLAAGPGAHTVPPRPVSHTLGHTFLWRAVRFRSIFSTRVSNVSFLFGLCFRSVLVSGESPLRVRLIVQGVLKREVMTEVPQSDHFGNLPFYLTAGHIWDHPEELV